ncbi:MAG TPA: hypothetical protein VJP80_06765 [Candidatus Saccharimonadales bacterium]|nr:hypothetical protein [Candidatus Saccharimonadales bacterium]
MMVVALVSWWYGAGWARVARRSGERIGVVLETFSVELLLRTLFAPFRQISAGSVRGPLNAQVQAWLDRTFSRVFGAVVRSLFILFGLLAALLTAVISIVQLVLWPIVPLLPVVGLILMLLGLLT